MSIKSDYHIHTYLCKHAVGNPIEYLASAHKKGLNTIGFSDHCPLPRGFDVENRMDISQFCEYVDIVNDLKDNSFGIEVLLGMEVDWVPGRMDEVYDLLQNTDYDYLIGSVHHIDVKGQPFDHPSYMELWNTQEKTENIWNKYIDKMIDMVSSGRFDIIGHFDLPKKFGLYPKDLTYFINKSEDLFLKAAELGVALELNTAGLRKPVKEIYPSLDLLQSAKAHNVKITFGSDSHAPGEIAANFAEAEKLARKAGYTEYLHIGRNGTKTMIKLQKHFGFLIYGLSSVALVQGDLEFEESIESLFEECVGGKTSIVGILACEGGGVLLFDKSSLVVAGRNAYDTYAAKLELHKNTFHILIREREECQE